MDDGKKRGSFSSMNDCAVDDGNGVENWVVGGGADSAGGNNGLALIHAPLRDTPSSSSSTARISSGIDTYTRHEYSDDMTD
jgi:hypothetical protein